METNNFRTFETKTLEKYFCVKYLGETQKFGHASFRFVIQKQSSAEIVKFLDSKGKTRDNPR